MLCQHKDFPVIIIYQYTKIKRKIVMERVCCAKSSSEPGRVEARCELSSAENHSGVLFPNPGLWRK